MDVRTDAYKKADKHHDNFCTVNVPFPYFLQKDYRRMDGRTGGRRDGRTDKPTDEWKDGWTDRRMDGWTHLKRQTSIMIISAQ